MSVVTTVTLQVNQETEFICLVSLQRVIDPNSLPVPAVSGDRLPAHHALHVPPDCSGCSWQLRPAEPGAQHQPHLHWPTGEMSFLVVGRIPASD